MADPKDLPIRTQFLKGATATQIYDAIKQMQDAWAIKHPELAHRLYPKTYPDPKAQNPKE